MVPNRTRARVLALCLGGLLGGGLALLVLGRVLPPPPKSVAVPAHTAEGSARPASEAAPERLATAAREPAPRPAEAEAPPWRAMAEILAELDAIDLGSERVLRLPDLTEPEAPPLARYAIGAPGRLATLETRRAAARILAHPSDHSEQDIDRARALGGLTVVITAGVHPLEPSAVHGLPALLQTLADPAPDDRALFDQLVVILVPSVDPSGHDAVVDHGRRTFADHRTRGLPPDELVHRYAGRDLNRDGLFATQPETRLLHTGVFQVEWPQLVIDRHEMPDRDGRVARPRLFVPPYREPIDPLIHPLLRQGLAELGTALRKDLVARGARGLTSERWFDAHDPARNLPFWYGAARCLIEVAHADLRPHLPPAEAPARALAGDPPWPGGPWTFDDAIDLQNQATLAALRVAATDAQGWLDRFIAIRRDQSRIHPGEPAGWLIDPRGVDPLLSRRFEAFLAHHGIRWAGLASTDANDPRRFVPRDQPMGQLLMASFRAPAFDADAPRPYDWWTCVVPLCLGIEATEATERPELRPTEAPRPLLRLRDDQNPLVAPEGGVAITDPDLGETCDLLAAGQRGALVSIWPRAGRGPTYRLDAGTELRWARPGPPAPTAPPKWRGRHRVAILPGCPEPSDSGFLRAFFADADIPMPALPRDPPALATALQAVEVVLLPHRSPGLLGRGARPADEIAAERAVSLFVRRGGRLVGIDGGSELALRILGLAGATPGLERIQGPEGVHVRLSVSDHPLLDGLPRDLAWLWSGGSAFDHTLPGLHPLLTAPNPLEILAGPAAGLERLSGRPLAGTIRCGQGELVLFSASPLARGATFSTLLPLLRALLPTPP